MKYHIIVFGCQMNISDAERISAVLESAGYEHSPSFETADLAVVTMCSVRQSAVDRVDGLANKFLQIKKKKPNFKAILTGCVLKKDKIKLAKGFDFVIDIKEIAKIPELLVCQQGSSGYASPASAGLLSPRRATPLRGDRAGATARPLRTLLPNKSALSRVDNYLDITPKYTSQFSANVPIMTGCNNFCAYCVVPYTRDREVSRSATEIIAEITNAVKQGFKEFWLLGQNVNSYKAGDVNFPKLLKLINNIPGEFWIRFTSSHPKDFNEKVIEAMATLPKVTPYLNLPVQAGDNKVLKSMNRHYTVADYKKKIKALRKSIPHIAISTDIIVGFPGETKAQFKNTAKLFHDVKYDMAYINKYSKREGTAAAKLKDNVTLAEKKRREKVLTEILKETALEHNKKMVGQTVNVLFNESRGENYFGKDEHYKTIKVKSDKNILGQLLKVKITKAEPFILKGEILQ